MTKKELLDLAAHLRREVRALKAQTNQLRQEIDVLRAELETKTVAVERLNRRIEWMQRYAHERQTDRRR